MPIGSPLVNLQVKVSQELSKTFEDALMQSECTTRAQFLESILESYLNPPKGKPVEVSRKEDQDVIQNLTNEIGRLKILIDQKDESELDEKLKLIKEIQDLNGEIQDLTSNNQTLQTSVPADDQVLITIPPICRKVLEIEAEICKKKTGKEFSIGDILLNSFWESVVVGRVYPFRAWTKGEISDLAKKLQAGQ